MIGAGLRYGRPETIREALDAFRTEKEAGWTPLYYAGGTEAATLGKKGKIALDTLIDLKGIPECMELGTEENFLRIGAALPLNTVIDSGLFPLFSSLASGIADRTVRNRLSVGGNIAGRLPYREAVLPFLLTGARAVIAGPEGVRTEPVMVCFDKRLILQPGEFIVRFEVPAVTVNLPFCAIRKTGHSRIDYPIVHAVGVAAEGKIRIAVSGLCSFPFRSAEVEEPLNAGGTVESRVQTAINALPGPVRNDSRAGRDYRTFLARQAFEETVTTLEASR